MDKSVHPAHDLAVDTLVVLLEKLADTYGTSSPTFRKEVLSALKAEIAAARKSAEEQLCADGKGTACAMRLSANQDELIRAIYRFASTRLYPAVNPSTSERVSVVAVGGYGRGTLAPGSDIDLLFVLPYKQTAWGESVVEFILYLLWDLGFKVGNATRSVDQCIRLASEDGTILTSILEARYICGDRELFDELEARFRKEVTAKNAEAFIADKLAERELRHAKAGESRYLVEPDVKDGKGGMRDLHTLFWIAKYLYGTKTAKDLSGTGIFTRRELNRFHKCEDFLWAVRCHLHFASHRSGDRLSFDLQAELAERLGYTSHGGLKHVERFMRHYFLTAKDVGDLTGIFCAVLEAKQVKRPPRMSRFFSKLRRPGRKIKESADFTIITGRISNAREDVYDKDPVNLLRLFWLASKYDVTIHPDTLKLVRRSLKLIGKDLRTNPQANRLFLEMLTDRDDPEAILRRMNEAGVLGRFIPDFGKIVAMMQFNMYHHYTVDEHLLRAVGVISDIERGDFNEEHPLSTDIIHTLKSRRVLIVATLLHDIAKGRKEDHSIAGERVAQSLCLRLGMTPAETDTVAWLVRHHLLMSETAQMRDLNDFKTILDFTAVVQSPERLKLLLILTVADIRAVGPGVWNGWKGQLLRTLYYEAEPIVSGGHSSISSAERAQAAQAGFAERVPEWSERKLKAYFKRHYEPYWLNTDIEHQLMHADLLTKLPKDEHGVATTITTDEFTAITEITIAAPDHPRLLALLTGACAAGGGNIAGAQIFTTADGIALDTLLVQRQFEQEEDEQRRAERICSLIRQALSGELRVRDAVARATGMTRRMKAFTVEPQVVINNDSSNRFTVIEVAGMDRIGLLFDLTEALFRLNLNIASAHITTFGERAVDVFYVTDLTGAKITNANRRAKIMRQMMAALTPGETSDRHKLAG
jgi:[protein-PII] uridylyltransferase